MLGEYDNTPQEVFPDSAYKERLGYHTYSEVLIYDGPASRTRFEFKLPTNIPVPWSAVKRVVEARIRMQGHKLLRLGLWRGPETKDSFGGVPVRSYKMEITEHGSPVAHIVVAAIIGLGILFGVSLLIIAMKMDTESFRSIAKGIGDLPSTVKYAAIAVVVVSLAGTAKALKPG